MLSYHIAGSNKPFNDIVSIFSWKQIIETTVFDQIRCTEHICLCAQFCIYVMYFVIYLCASKGSRFITFYSKRLPTFRYLYHQQDHSLRFGTVKLNNIVQYTVAVTKYHNTYIWWTYMSLTIHYKLLISIKLIDVVSFLRMLMAGRLFHMKRLFLVYFDQTCATGNTHVLLSQYNVHVQICVQYNQKIITDDCLTLYLKF